MSAKLDKFFQDKLTGHTMTPSPGAWAKVEAGLTKKNDGLVWFRWAAVLLIPVILAGVLVLRRSEDNATNIAAHVEKNKKDQTKKDTAEKKTPDALKKRSVDTTPLKSSPAQQNTQRPATTPRSKQLINVPLENMTAANVEQNSKEDAIRKDETLAVPAEASQNTAQLNEIKETNIIAPVAETSVAAVQKEKPIVLEYTLAGVEPETPVEKGITLTMELKEKSRFQKVFDFARGAKNSDGPFTVLRQAKQELFAFNLKKDKHPK